jgi:arylsulfatase A-like enzyme
VPHTLQGRSLRPLFDGEKSLPDYPPLFGEHEGGRSVITPDGWKLVRDRGESQWHLYNLNADETEMNDLFPQQGERAAKMQAMWDQWANENDVLPKP